MSNKHHSKRSNQGKGKRQPEVTLDDALREQYPESFIAAINDIFDDEVTEWRRSTLGIRFTITKESSTLALQIRLTFRRLVAILTGAGTIITIIITEPNWSAAWNKVAIVLQNIAAGA